MGLLCSMGCELQCRLVYALAVYSKAHCTSLLQLCPQALGFSAALGGLQCRLATS